MKLKQDLSRINFNYKKKKYTQTLTVAFLGFKV